MAYLLTESWFSTDFSHATVFTRAITVASMTSGTGCYIVVGSVQATTQTLIPTRTHEILFSHVEFMNPNSTREH